VTGELLVRLLWPAQAKVWDNLQSVAEAPRRQIAAATDVPLPTVTQAINKLLRRWQGRRHHRGHRRSRPLRRQRQAARRPAHPPGPGGTAGMDS
jgi:hypothetical protein